MGLTEILENHFWSELQANQKLATFWKCSLDSRVARKKKILIQTIRLDTHLQQYQYQLCCVHLLWLKIKLL